MYVLKIFAPTTSSIYTVIYDILSNNKSVKIYILSREVSTGQ